MQAKLKEEVYVGLPEGFMIEEGDDPPEAYALKLNKSLYGLCEAPMYWFLHLKENLEKQGLKQSKIDPCLFYGDGLCVLCYVDDCLFFAKDMDWINNFIDKLKNSRFSLTDKDDVYVFLRVEVNPGRKKDLLC